LIVVAVGLYELGCEIKRARGMNLRRERSTGMCTVVWAGASFVAAAILKGGGESGGGDVNIFISQRTRRKTYLVEILLDLSKDRICLLRVPECAVRQRR